MTDLMGHGLTDREGRLVTLRDIGDDWQRVGAVAPRDNQRGFVHPVAAPYILLSTFGDTWHSLGVYADEDVVGHIMWALDDEDGSHWIGGLMIDASQQGLGLGRAATSTLLGWLAAQDGCWVVRLSFDPHNTSAAALYASMGFAPNGESMDDEMVVERPPQRSAT